MSPHAWCASPSTGRGRAQAKESTLQLKKPCPRGKYAGRGSPQTQPPSPSITRKNNQMQYGINNNATSQMQEGGSRCGGPPPFFRGGSILQSDLCVPSTRPFAFQEPVDFSNTRPFVAILMCPFLFCVAEHLRMGKFQKVTHATEYQQRDSQLTAFS